MDQASDLAKLEALDQIFAEADAMFPVKWMDLESARSQVAISLLDAYYKGKGRPDDELDDSLMRAAVRRAGVVLVSAFCDETLPTRGVEHLADSQLLLHRALPPIWWNRTVDIGDDLDEADADLPVHILDWSASQIVRVLPREPGKRLGVVTDVAVDFLALDKIAPLGAVAAAPERKPRQWAKTAARRAALLKQAEESIRVHYGSVEAFAKEVADGYATGGGDIVDSKTVRRYIFERTSG